jgi:hypothetical protein
MQATDEVDLVRVRVLPDRRVSRQHAALILGRTAKTLAEWKTRGWGPRAIVVGGRIFHDYDECLAMARGEKPIKQPLRAA